MLFWFLSIIFTINVALIVDATMEVYCPIGEDEHD